MSNQITQKKRVIAKIHIFYNNCETFWIEITQETQILQDHWLHGRMTNFQPFPAIKMSHKN